MKVPKSHPRYVSLTTRDNVVKGVELGITSIHGLIAHGRGEAFDYLIGEKTRDFAKKAITASALMLVNAKNPVISVNGNVAALCPKELVKLSNILNCPLEVNIFHKSKSREKNIMSWLIKNGAKKVLMPTKPIIKISHNRKYCNPDGIAIADVVFVPLEDGDRCRALRKMGKEVITIDLNPLSRTARSASITIVDNITRALPLLIMEITKLRKNKTKQFVYNNNKTLKESISCVLSSF